MSTRFLTVPGLAGSGPQHWQTIWEIQQPDLFNRIEQDNWDWPNREDWVERLQEIYQQIDIADHFGSA